MLPLVACRKSDTGRLSRLRRTKIFLDLVDFIFLLLYFIDTDTRTTFLRIKFDNILAILQINLVAVKNGFEAALPL